MEIKLFILQIKIGNCYWFKKFWEVFITAQVSYYSPFEFPRCFDGEQQQETNGKFADFLLFWTNFHSNIISIFITIHKSEHSTTILML